MCSSSRRHLILRKSWVCATRGGSFARTMRRLAGERDALTVIDDKIGAPARADLLANLTAHTFHACRADPARCGRYHCAAAGETSGHAYGRFVIEWARTRGHALKTAPNAVCPIATRDYPTDAAIPLNSRLDTRRLQKTFGLTLPPWQPGVDRMLSDVLAH